MTEYERGFIDGVRSKVTAELTPTIIKMTDGLSQTIQEAVKTVIGNVKITVHEPASDDQPVKRGKWLSRCEGDIYEFSECSECGNTESCETPYCAQCGARMDLKDGDNNA